MARLCYCSTIIEGINQMQTLCCSLLKPNPILQITSPWAWVRVAFLVESSGENLEMLHNSHQFGGCCCQAGCGRVGWEGGREWSHLSQWSQLFGVQKALRCVQCAAHVHAPLPRSLLRYTCSYVVLWECTSSWYLLSLKSPTADNYRAKKTSLSERYRKYVVSDASCEVTGLTGRNSWSSSLLSCEFRWTSVCSITDSSPVVADRL